MRFTFGAILAVATLVDGAGAQEPIQAKLPGITVEANAKADRLRQAAEALYEQPKAYRRAALLHEKEAATRSALDPLQADALTQSARLYSYSGDIGKSRIVMERSAQSALQRGDVLRAAHTLLDAAFLSLRERDREHTKALTQQAELLSASPLLTAAQRAAILRRIDPARVEQAYAK